MVVGRLAALEAELVGTVRTAKAVAGDPLAPVVVLIGETLLRPYLGRRLATDLGGHANVRFLTAGDLGLVLGERRLVAEGRGPLPFLGDQVLAQRAARETDGYFAPVGDMGGFAAALHRTLRELRQARVGPAALAASAAAADRAAGDQPDKLAALAALYAATTEARAPFYDPDDALAAADPGAFDAVALVIHGIWQASAALRGALSAVGERIPITALLPGTGTAADGVLAEWREWLEDQLGAATAVVPGAEAGVSQDAALSTTTDSTDPAPDDLARVKSGLFARHAARGDGAAGGPSADRPGVRLVSAPDPGREAQAAVRACLRWADEGIAFHEMAIAYRHADPYRGLLDAAFREAGIPAYLHEGTPLAERPLGRQVLSLLDLVDTGLTRADVIAFLADARLPEATFVKYGRVSAARWDAISREAGIVEGLDQWTERLATYARERRDRRAPGGNGTAAEDTPPLWAEERARAAEHLSAFVTDLDATLSARRETAMWGEHLFFLRTALTDYVQGPERVLDSLEGLARLDPLAGSISFEGFADAVRHAIASLRDDGVLAARAGAFGLRGVNVLDVNSLRHLRFRAVAVVGLAERAFPPPPRQDALLLDAERERLSAAHGWELPLRARGGDPEPLQFALAVDGADERLHLSYPRTQSGTARALLPSSLLRAAVTALTGEEVTAEELPDLSIVERISAGRLGAARPEDAVSAAQYERTLVEQQRPLGLALLDRRHPALPRARAAEDARWARELTAYDGMLGPDGVAALAAHWTQQRAISPSALETYAQCPYRHFLAGIMRLRKAEAPETTVRISALDRGSLVHKILERFVREHAGDPPDPSRRGAHLPRLGAIGREECDAADARGETGYAMLWRADRARILDDLVRWYDAEAARPPAERLPQVACEVRFGPAWLLEDADPGLSREEPVEVPVGDGRTLLVQGRIDRLEYDGDSAFRVTDYKTGRHGSNHQPNTLQRGEGVQLPIYLYAAGALLGTEPEGGEAEYFYATRDGGFRRVPFDGEQLVERADDLSAVLAGIAGGIAAGDFHAEPQFFCRFCDFDGLCDKRRRIFRDRKAGDERLVARAIWRDIP